MSGELPEDILGPEIDQFFGEDGQDEQQEEAQENQAGADEEGLDGLDLDEETQEVDENAELTGEEEQQDAKPAVAMPESWSKEDAQHWQSLPPEVQEVVARREGERDKYLRKAAFDASQTRQKVEGEARNVLAQMAENHAVTLNAYAQRFIAQEPDQRLLYTGNPDDVLIYQRQDAAFRASQAQQQQLQQEIAQALKLAESARGQTQQADLISDAQRLREQLPEWFDPSEGPKLKTSLGAIGAELGYPDELMAQASSTDILALKQAAEWKAKADKFDKIVSKKMEAVRAAKGLPKMARPGAQPAKNQVQQRSREQAWDRTVKSSGRARESAFADWAESSGLI